MEEQQGFHPSHQRNTDELVLASSPPLSTAVHRRSWPSLITASGADGSPVGAVSKLFTTPFDVCLFVYYAVVVAIGVAMNSFVIYRMRRFKRRDREQYRNGIGICLFGMAISNLVSLFALVIQSGFRYATIVWHLPPVLLESPVCKSTMFAGHSAYTQAMWLWVLMSFMRYLATRRPLEYHSRRISHMAIGAILSYSLVFNMWLLVATYNGECKLQFNLPNRAHRLIDVFTSFLMPMVTLIYTDISVLFGRRKHSDPMLQIVINRPNGERKRVFHRFLLITISSVLLNIPENTKRLVGIIWPLEKLSPSHMTSLCEALYFLQFAFNAFYLTTFVYDRSVLSKTNSSRQLSVSFRFRLEAEVLGNEMLLSPYTARLHALTSAERIRSYTLDPTLDRPDRRHTAPSGPRMGRRNASCCALYLLPPTDDASKKHSVGCQSKVYHTTSHGRFLSAKANLPASVAAAADEKKRGNWI